MPLGISSWPLPELHQVVISLSDSSRMVSCATSSAAPQGSVPYDGVHSFEVSVDSSLIFP